MTWYIVRRLGQAIAVVIGVMILTFILIHMEPGNAYTIDVGPCFVGAGTCVAGMTSTNDTNFWFFQDQDECPIGIYTAYSYGLPTPAGGFGA